MLFVRRCSDKTADRFIKICRNGYTEKENEKEKKDDLYADY